MFNPRHPLFDTYKSLIGGIYTLEGLIGVGKTCLGISIVSFLNSLGLNAQFFPEYVNKDFLNEYIEDMPKYSYAYQVMMLCKRIEIYKDAERFANLGGIAIIDRSLIGDMTFARMQRAKGFMTERNWNNYLSMARDEIQSAPSASIYLSCTTETSLGRVRTRGLESEIKGYTPEYMDDLRNAYEKSIADCTTVKHMVVDWNQRMDIVNGLLSETCVRSILDRIIKG
jgi:deoxyadenosine/deoxycytidine kinase